MKHNDGLLPGGVMSVGRQGKVVFEECFGVRDVKTRVPMTTDTIFNVASMTKSVTCIAAGILFERGIIALDDPVSKWLPEFSVDRLKVAAPYNKTVSCRNPITIRMTMNNTTGFSYGSFFSRPAEDPMLQTDEGLRKMPETVQDFENVVLAFQPGTRFRYGPSTIILGWVVEKASGQSLEEFFFKEIFGPLGMMETGFSVPEAERSRIATTYHDAELTGPGKHGAFVDQGNWERLTRYDGGCTGKNAILGDKGLYSTAADWQRFMHMLAARGAGLITEQTWTTLTRPSTPDLDALDVIDAISKRRPASEVAQVRTTLFCTHYSDRLDGRTCGKASVGPRAFAYMAPGGFAYNLIGEVATTGGSGNSIGVSRGTFGWEGFYSTTYTVDPAEQGLTVCFLSSVAPPWQFNTKLELWPGVYQALIQPEQHHPTPLVQAVAPWTDDALSLGYHAPTGPGRSKL